MLVEFNGKGLKWMGMVSYRFCSAMMWGAIGASFAVSAGDTQSEGRSVEIGPGKAQHHARSLRSYWLRWYRSEEMNPLPDGSRILPIRNWPSFAIGFPVSKVNNFESCLQAWDWQAR